ncbi:hypothetical protein [Chryseobacterium sp. CT-SW4]|uniref:hypothetical protein n=1 Tax=Chryseobacterium sp. SW-1 TaxID=3157343 RepID=UPI003B016014
MKKFISLVALATLLVSVVSCREADNITDIEEDIITMKMNKMKMVNTAKVADTVQEADAPVAVADNSESLTEDPPTDPPKDKQGW